MTTPDTHRASHVDPFVLSRRAGAGQHLLSLTVDVLAPIAAGAVAVVAFAIGLPVLGWLLVVAIAAVVAASLTQLARTGRSFGAVAAGTRTVDRSTGVAAGASLVAAFLSGRLRTYDLHRGRDPFAPALSPLVFPEPEPVQVPTVGVLRGQAPLIELDSGQRFSLGSVLVLGRDPSPSADAPAEIYQWPDLSRTLSKSHARLEWDGRVVWATDLGSTNGTLLYTAGAPRALLPFQRTSLPPEATLALGDRVVIVKAAP